MTGNSDDEVGTMPEEHRPPSEPTPARTTDDDYTTAPADGGPNAPQRSPTRRSRRNALLTVGASAALGAFAFGLVSHAETGSPATIVEGSHAPAPAVMGTNGDGGPAVEGDASGGDGVIGTSIFGRGVYGKSSANYGVHGTSSTGDGVYGTSTSGRGVYGTSNQSYGVVGESIEIGVYGKSSHNFGVVGESTDNTGVFGVSGLGSFSSGVYGTSDKGPGVSGQSTRGPGVYGSAAGGNVAVKAENFDGNVSVQAIGHLWSSGGEPSAAAGAQAGSGAPVPAAIAGSTDTKGSITFGTGAGPADGAQVVVTFYRAYPTAPVVILTPTNAATQKLGLYVTSTTTGFTVSTASAPGRNTPNTTYGFNYLVMQ